VTTNPPTPAVVTQAAVRRLPRIALWLFCLAYIIPGFIGRDPWRSQDMASFGAMREIAQGRSGWWSIDFLGQAPDISALLPYWLGALAIKLCPAWLPIDFAARIPFALLLGVTLATTWYAVYYLARRPEAQPVPFAFGGEARPTDYARAMADGGLLAMIAMLGLAQLSHETTPYAAQLAFTGLLFYAYAASPYHLWLPAACATVASLGLALSGVPAFGMALAGAGALARALQTDTHAKRWALGFAALGAACSLIAMQLGLWFAHTGTIPQDWSTWRSWGKLMLWFAWPAWPLAMIALWKWRAWWRHLHIMLPLALASVIIFATIIAPRPDRSLLLAAPTLACLAVFALPTLQRNVTALIDWFTLLFFSGCGLVIWVVWIAMQTGIPAQPAANVRRLVPGFEASFSLLPFIAAVLATAAWVWLVAWRAGRHRDALWKSLVLPASGAATSWLLLMTLWMPMLNYVRSDLALVRQVTRHIGDPTGCVAVYGVSQSEATALAFHGRLNLQAFENGTPCEWLISHPKGSAHEREAKPWKLLGGARRRSSDTDDLLVYQRVKK
jgi:4-amino-4-deoxy-L-arabinose transferase-like glycosyltransferase